MGTTITKEVKPNVQIGTAGQKYISGRRYKIGEHPIYDRRYGALKSHSQILNQSDHKPNPYSINISDKQGLIVQRYLLMGVDEKDGKFINSSGVWEIATIPEIKSKIAVLQKEFDDWAQTQVNNGYHRPKQMLPGMMEERLKLEANLDIATAELAKIDLMISKFKNKEEEKRNSKVLYYGLQGNGRLKDGILCEIDGQRVSQFNGILVIDEPVSPYDGMAVADYRELAKQWRNDRIAVYTGLKKRREAEIAEKGASNIIAQYPYSCHVKREDLPAWPKGVKNYKKSE
jgi:hypothetical protein